MRTVRFWRRSRVSGLSQWGSWRGSSCLGEGRGTVVEESEGEDEEGEGEDDCDGSAGAVGALAVLFWVSRAVPLAGISLKLLRSFSNILTNRYVNNKGWSSPDY